MIVAALLLAASLDDAQAAFANGAYPEAESLALAAAEPPPAGAALYLAALARFRAGLAAFDAGKFAEARAHFRKSSALDPTDGRSRVMSGASALRLGAKDDARDDITRGLALRLGADDAQAARAYLSELTARSDWRFA